MNASEGSQRLRRFLAALAVSAFALNWPWEMLQMPAYAEMAGKSWHETLGPCTRATLGDVAITLGVCGVGVLASGSLRWPMAAKWSVYATAALLGGACGTAYEWKALGTGRWSYTEAMPVVPLLDVGLWPLLQLALLVPLAVGLSGWWARRR